MPTAWNSCGGGDRLGKLVQFQAGALGGCGGGACIARLAVSRIAVRSSS